MRCPACGTPDSRVVDSRTAQSGRAIRRRRECVTCGKRFTTYETIEEGELVVIKSDGRREPFDRNKVFRGIQIACTKRPVSTDQIEGIVDRVAFHMNSLGEREVSTKRIGELVMEELRKLDEVAFVRFASVYREFKDRGEFLEELRHLDNPRGERP